MNEARTLSNTTHTHTHKAQMIKDLNLKPETIKLFEETVGRTLSHKSQQDPL